MEVKIFKVKGTVTKPNYVMPFSKEVRALKPEDALEKIYTDFGSQHKVKRTHLKIISVIEIPLEEAKNVSIRVLSEE